MFPRYFKVLKRNLFLIIVIIALVIVSSVTKGKTAKTTSILAGVVMIYLGIKFFIWIIRAPVKKEKDEAM